MKSNRFQLTSRSGLAVWKSLSITLITLLSVPSAAFANLRSDLSLRKAGINAIVTASAPLAASIEVNTTSDGDNVNPSVGCDTDAVTPGDQCSLRAAIQRANALAGDDVIKINIPLTEPNCTTSGSCSINLTMPLPPLSTNVRIEGPGAEKLTVRRSTGGDYRVFTVLSASEVTFSNIKISGGRPFGVNSGGAIANAGDATVNITDCILSGNVAGADGGSGGAIANGGSGTINVVNSVVSANPAAVPVVDNASGGGGGIVNMSTGTVNITNSFN